MKLNRCEKCGRLAELDFVGKGIRKNGTCPDGECKVVAEAQPVITPEGAITVKNSRQVQSGKDADGGRFVRSRPMGMSRENIGSDFGDGLRSHFSEAANYPWSEWVAER